MSKKNKQLIGFVLLFISIILLMFTDFDLESNIVVTILFPILQLAGYLLILGVFDNDNDDDDDEHK